MFQFLKKLKPTTRSAGQQTLVDTQTQKLALYHFSSCPFCLMVRGKIKQLSLDIEQRDIRANDQFHQELLQQGGKGTVPCLRIEDNNKVTWMYESADITAYLEKRFANISIMPTAKA